MESDDSIYPILTTIEWFAHCGAMERGPFDFDVEFVSDAGGALKSALSDVWEDVRTEAKGDLTAYLAVNRAREYVDWNKLGTVARERVQGEVMPQVDAALLRRGLSELAANVRYDLGMIVQYWNYRGSGRPPSFYRRVLSVYQSGHLPCGWTTGIAEWPSGSLIVY